MYKNFTVCQSEVELFLSYYANVFQHYLLRFRKPQVDTYCFCEELEIQLKEKLLSREQQTALVITKIIHEWMARKFCSKMREIKDLWRNHPDTTGISMDYIWTSTYLDASIRIILSVKTNYQCFQHEEQTGKSDFFKWVIIYFFLWHENLVTYEFNV